MAGKLSVLRLHNNPLLAYRGWLPLPNVCWSDLTKTRTQAARISGRLHRVLPSLRFVPLSVNSWKDSAGRAYDSFVHLEESPHPHPLLTAVLRRFCRNAKHVHVDIPYICRDVLLDQRRSWVMDMAIRRRKGGPNPAISNVFRDSAWKTNELQLSTRKFRLGGKGGAAETTSSTGCIPR
jgi:hypothetical protein